MERTYNFQVDNGLFVAEYYLKKSYSKITIDDLRGNVGLLTEKMCEYNKLSTLSYVSHINSSLSNPAMKNKKNAVEDQLIYLLDNVGDDKYCMICGKKQVNVYADFPYGSLMYGLPSVDRFMNKGDNLMSIDVCPICLFLALLSFLNTQKISYPFLYNTDSDKFMRNITKDLQNNIGDILGTKMNDKVKELDILDGLFLENSLYDDMNYIELVYFQNGKSNYILEKCLDKEILYRLLLFKKKNLLGELVYLNLFNDLQQGNHFIKRLIDNDKLNCSNKFYKTVRDVMLLKKELELVDRITTNLLGLEDRKKVINDLKNCNSRQKFKNFLIKYANKTIIYENMQEFIELESKFYIYKDYILANIILISYKEGLNKDGE